MSGTVQEAYDPLYDPNIQELSIEDMMLHEAMSGHEDHTTQQGHESSVDILAGIGEITDAAAANVREVKSEISKRLEGFEPLLDASQYKENEVTEEQIQALDLKLEEMKGAAFGYNVASLKDTDYGEPVEEIIENPVEKVDLVEKASTESESVQLPYESSRKTSVQDLSIEDIVMQEALSSPENFVVQSDSNSESSGAVDAKQAETEIESEAAQRVEQFDNLIESLQFEEKEITQEHLQAVSEKLTEIQNIAYGHDLSIFSSMEQGKQKDDNVKICEDQSIDQCITAETSETPNEHKDSEANIMREQLADTEQDRTTLSEKESAQLELDNTLAEVAKSVDLGTSEKYVRDFDVEVQIAADPNVKPPNPQSGVPGSEPSLSIPEPSAGLTGAGVAMASATIGAATVPGLGVAAVSGGVMAAAKYQEKERPSSETHDKDAQKLDEALEETPQHSISDKTENAYADTEVVTEPATGSEKASTSENIECNLPDSGSPISADAEKVVENHSPSFAADNSPRLVENTSCDAVKSSLKISGVSTEEILESSKTTSHTVIIETSPSEGSQPLVIEKSLELESVQIVESSQESTLKTGASSTENCAEKSGETLASPGDISSTTVVQAPETVTNLEVKAAPEEIPDLLANDSLPEPIVNVNEAKTALSESVETITETVSNTTEPKSPPQETLKPAREALTEVVDSKSLASNSIEVASETTVSVDDITPTVNPEPSHEKPAHSVDMKSPLSLNSEPVPETASATDHKSVPTEGSEPTPDTLNSTVDIKPPKESLESLSSSADAQVTKADNSSIPKFTSVNVESKENASEESINSIDNLVSTAASMAATGAAVTAAASTTGAAADATVAPPLSTSKLVLDEPMKKSIPAVKPKPKLLGRKPLAKDKPKSSVSIMS